MYSVMDTFLFFLDSRALQYSSCRCTQLWILFSYICDATLGRYNILLVDVLSYGYFFIYMRCDLGILSRRLICEQHGEKDESCWTLSRRLICEQHGENICLNLKMNLVRAVLKYILSRRLICEQHGEKDESCWGDRAIWKYISGWILLGRWGHLNIYI
jgi:hypothetical protein